MSHAARQAASYSYSYQYHSPNLLSQKMKTAFVAWVLLLGLLLSNTVTMADDSYNCDDGCKQRCSRAAVQDRCLKYCGICCAKCKCVPSGTYGNKHQCPCYRDMLNSKGKPKCP